MTEPKKHRPVAEIQQEYTNLLVKAGQLHYQIQMFSDDLKTLTAVLKELNLEAAASQAAEKAEPKVEVASA